MNYIQKYQPAAIAQIYYIPLLAPNVPFVCGVLSFEYLPSSSPFYFHSFLTNQGHKNNDDKRQSYIMPSKNPPPNLLTFSIHLTTAKDNLHIADRPPNTPLCVYSYDPQRSNDNAKWCPLPQSTNQQSVTIPPGTQLSSTQILEILNSLPQATPPNPEILIPTS